MNWYDLIRVYARALATELHALSAPVCSASNQASLRAATGARRVQTRTPQATVEACGSLCYTAATSLSTNQRAAVHHSSLVIITVRVVILWTLLYRLLLFIPASVLSNHAFWAALHFQMSKPLEIFRNSYSVLIITRLLHIILFYLFFIFKRGDYSTTYVLAEDNRKYTFEFIIWGAYMFLKHLNINACWFCFDNTSL